MHTYRVHYPQTYERSQRRAPLHCFSTLARSMLICLAPRDLYSPADLIGPQQRQVRPGHFNRSHWLVRQRLAVAPTYLLWPFMASGGGTPPMQQQHGAPKRVAAGPAPDERPRKRSSPPPAATLAAAGPAAAAQGREGGGAAAASAGADQLAVAVFTCVKRSAVRDGFDQKRSKRTGFVEVGERVDALECRTNESGVVRVRFSGGWLSCTSQKGDALLEPVAAAAASTGASAIAAATSPLPAAAAAASTPESPIPDASAFVGCRMVRERLGFSVTSPVLLRVPREPLPAKHRFPYGVVMARLNNRPRYSVMIAR